MSFKARDDPYGPARCYDEHKGLGFRDNIKVSGRFVQRILGTHIGDTTQAILPIHSIELLITLYHMDAWDPLDCIRFWSFRQGLQAHMTSILQRKHEGYKAACVCKFFRPS